MRKSSSNVYQQLQHTLHAPLPRTMMAVRLSAVVHFISFVSFISFTASGFSCTNLHFRHNCDALLHLRYHSSTRYPSSTHYISSHERSITSSSRVFLFPQDVAGQEVAQETAAVASIFHHIFDLYMAKLEENPLTTKTLTASILACIGDGIAQLKSITTSSDGNEDDEQNKLMYDVRRGTVFLCFGALYTGFLQTLWFEYLSSHIADWGQYIGVWGSERVPIPVEPFVYWDSQWYSYFDVVAQVANPPTPVALAVGKLAVNQFLVVPTVYMPLFFAITGALGGLDAKQSLARAQSLYIPILQRNYFFWLPVQFFQFFVVPLDLQIPFVSASSLVWTIILSSIGGSSTPQASPSTIVSYSVEQGEYDDANVITVVEVNAGPANEITDDVRLEDVENALIPESVGSALVDETVVAGVRGGFIGLLTSAADDAVLGSLVSNLMNGEPGAGVAIITAFGAALGLLSNKDKNSNLESTSPASPQLQEPPEIQMEKDYQLLKLTSQATDSELLPAEANVPETEPVQLGERSEL